MRASHTFSKEIMLHGLRPHMHYRGKYMRMSVTPSGTLEDLINVLHYNFAWQLLIGCQSFFSPSRRVIIDGAFDNSIHNLGNPTPARGFEVGTKFG